MSKKIIYEDEETIQYRETYRTHPDRIGSALVIINKRLANKFFEERIKDFESKSLFAKFIKNKRSQGG